MKVISSVGKVDLDYQPTFFSVGRIELYCSVGKGLSPVLNMAAYERRRWLVVGLNVHKTRT